MTEEQNPRDSESLSEETAFTPSVVVRDEHVDTSFTRALEQQTAKIPSHWFLFASLASMAASLALEIGGKSRWSRFVGMWALPSLMFGMYNKLVKSLVSR